MTTTNKTILFLTLILLISGCSKEEAKSGTISDIRDSNFRSYVLSEFDMDGDGQLSKEEMMSVQEIDCGFSRSIYSLEGTEIFPNLRVLEFPHGRISSLDVSKNKKLEVLNCIDNRLTELNLSSNKALVKLNCSDNNLTQLDITNNRNLKIIYCRGLKLLKGADLNLEIFGDTNLQIVYKTR